MERIQASVPKPLAEELEEYQKEKGYENKSQTIRVVLRKGLNEGGR